MIYREDVHYMRLKEDPFERIKSGQKKMELRLYDSKRWGIHIGDYIIFKKLPDENEEIAVRVKSLHIFNSFKDLFEELPKERFGIAVELSVDEAVEKMREYYSEEEEKRNGVLGIGIEVCDLEKVHILVERIKEAHMDYFFPDGIK